MTIQIFLPDGNPHGVRVAELTTRTIRVFDVPRSLLDEFQAMPEASQVGVYCLLQEDEAAGSTSCYIGQSGTVGGRLGQHDKVRASWDRALIAVSLTDNMTDTHARYLEWRSMQLTREAGRFELQNGNQGTRPHTPAPLQADCEEILDTIRVLYGTLGFPLFDQLPTGKPQSTEELFYCQGRGADAKGRMTAEGMVVLAESRCAVEPTAAATPDTLKAQRQRLLEQGVLRLDDDVPVFTKDYLFKSPSGAACAVMYRNANGWREWKTRGGQSLDTARRQDGSQQEEGLERA